MTKMADGVDIDLYADDLEQDFAQVTAYARALAYVASKSLTNVIGASRTAMFSDAVARFALFRSKRRRPQADGYFSGRLLIWGFLYSGRPSPESRG